MDDLDVALNDPAFSASGPACWGPLQWMALHQFARGYPRSNPSPAQRAAVQSYVTALSSVMPCPRCASHWQQIAPTVVDALDDRKALLKWTIDVHNSVNARLGKPVLTYGQAVAAIQGACPSNRLAWRACPPPSGVCLPTADFAAMVGLLSFFLLLFIVLFAVSMARRRRPLNAA